MKRLEWSSEKIIFENLMVISREVFGCEGSPYGD